MGIRINTNIDALSAQRNLGLTGLGFSRAVGRLSSGLRITMASDDAAGLSISEKLKSQSQGLLMAVRNSQDGISLIQTAEGALNETHSLLQRMRELSVQAANNATLTDDDANAIRLEIVDLKAEIDRIANNTEFNGKVLLSGTAGVTVDTAGTVSEGKSPGTLQAIYTQINVGAAQASSRYTLSGAGGTITMTGTVGGSLVTQGIVGTALTNSSQTFAYSTFGITFIVQGTAASATLLSTNMNGNVLLTSANAAVQFQIGANENQTLGVTITSALTADIGKTIGTYDDLEELINTITTGALMKTLADEMIDMVDDSIVDVSTIRSGLGAKSNRLTHTIANLNVGAENMTASASRITDADIATETVGFVRAQILQQAGTAVLAQANQAPQVVLALLR